MRKISNILTGCILMLGFFACEEDINRPLSNDKDAPGPVSNATVKICPGRPISPTPCHRTLTCFMLKRNIPPNKV